MAKKEDIRALSELLGAKEGKKLSEILEAIEDPSGLFFRKLEKFEEGLSTLQDSHNAVAKLSQDERNQLADALSVDREIIEKLKEGVDFFVKEVKSKRLRGRQGPKGDKGDMPKPRQVERFVKKWVKKLLIPWLEKNKAKLKGDKGDRGEPGIDGLDGKDGDEISAEQVRDKLADLQGEARLDATAIRNLPHTITSVVQESPIFPFESMPQGNVYKIKAGSNVTVSGDGQGEVTISASGGAENFLALTDTPSSYASQGLKALRVNSAEDALEFYTPTDANDAAVWGNITGTLANQTDLQTALDAKAASSHSHTKSDLTDIADFVLETEVGSVVQAWDAHLDSLAGLTPGLEGNFITSDGLGTYQISTVAQVRSYLNVEDGADVTDAANVQAAGALMDSEVDADLKTLSLPANTTISTFGASLIDDAAASNARTTLGLGSAAEVATDLADLNEATIEAAIDTLANLTSIQGLTVTLADAGANAIFGWDDTAGAYENLSVAEASAIIDHDQTTNFDSNEHFTQANITTVGTVTTGNVDAVVSSASATVAGKVELATASETTTGTDTGRAVTPDGLAGSDFGKRIVSIKISEDGGDALTTGDGKFHYFVPAELGGMNLVDVSAGVSTASSSGTPEVQIHNLTDTADMLSTTLTIDANEKHSKDATTAVVIDTSNDDVAEGDELRIDVDTAGTGTKGLQVDLVFQLP